MKRAAKITALILLLLAAAARAETAAQIQSRINVKAAAGGGVVELAAGVHTVEATITIPAKIHLVGEGRATALVPQPGVTVLKFTGNWAGVRRLMILSKAGCTGIELNGRDFLTIADVQVQGGDFGVRNCAATSMHVSLTRVWLQSQAIAGVRIDKAANQLHIREGRILNCPVGYELRAGTGNTIAAVDIASNGIGIHAAATVNAGVKGLIALANRFENNTTDVKINSNTHNCHVFASYAADNNGQLTVDDAGTGNRFDFAP